MTSEGAQWLAGVRVGVLSAETLYGRARAEQAVVVMSPATASRGLLLCGLRDIAALEDFVGVQEGSVEIVEKILSILGGARPVHQA